MADDKKQDQEEEETEVEKTEVSEKASSDSDEKAAGKDTEKTTEKAASKKPAAKKADKASKKPATDLDKAPKHKHTIALPIFIVVAVACLAAGIAIGYFGITSMVSSSFNGATTISESQLDSTIATYTYNGKSTNVTAREVIEATTSLDSEKQDDGSYSMPSADNVLSTVRNSILAQEAEAQGISVSDDDVSSYAESTLGSSDYATIASQYSMTEDQVKTILKQSCMNKQLYDSVVTTTVTSAPTAPTEPADGASDDDMTADYGSYVVGLLGDEWDSTTNTWARTDGPYYSAMSSMTFTSDSASYTQAETAYYVAYQQYSQSSSSASTEWTDYVNGLLSKASINIDSLVS